MPTAATSTARVTTGMGTGIRANTPPRTAPDQPPYVASAFPTASIQSTASSDKYKPSGPSSPTHHASDATFPPAATTLATTSAGSASPLCAISQSLVPASRDLHHSIPSTAVGS